MTATHWRITSDRFTRTELQHIFCLYEDIVELTSYVEEGINHILIKSNRDRAEGYLDVRFPLHLNATRVSTIDYPNMQNDFGKQKEARSVEHMEDYLHERRAYQSRYSRRKNKGKLMTAAKPSLSSQRYGTSQNRELRNYIESKYSV